MIRSSGIRGTHSKLKVNLSYTVAPGLELGLSSWKTGSLWGQRQGQALCYAMCAGGISDLKDDVAQAEQDSSFVFGVL